MAMSEDQKKQLTYVAVGAAACAALYFGYKHCAGASEGGAKSPKKSPKKIPQEKKKAASPDSKDSQIWTVTVTKSMDGRYGMVWKNTRQPGRCLKITDLKPQGAIAKMNKTLAPNVQIKPNDFIRAVNGKRTYEEMRSELGADSLTLELERLVK